LCARLHVLRHLKTAKQVIIRITEHMRIIWTAERGGKVLMRMIHPLVMTGFVVSVLGIGFAAGWLSYSDKVASLAPENQTEQAGDTWQQGLAHKVLRQSGIISQQEADIDRAKRETRHQVEALGARLGILQAEVLRLNALGRRLSDVASLDEGEFNFSSVPAVGGPAPLLETESGLGAAFSNDNLLVTLENLSSEVVRNKNQLLLLETLIIDRKLDYARSPDVWPTATGWVSSGFGKRRDPISGRKAFHEGIDIAADAGTLIKAVASGVVIDAGKDGQYGLVVEINHGDGVITRYAHTGALSVKTGDKVKKGQVIAIVGSSGRSTGPHLHFEVISNSKHIDPRKYLLTSG